jgi:hypothetical protein
LLLGLGRQGEPKRKPPETGGNLAGLIRESYWNVKKGKIPDGKMLSV